MQHFRPYSENYQWIIFDVAPLDCHRQSNRLRALSDIDFTQAEKVGNNLTLSLYNDHSFQPSFSAHPLKHNIFGKIHLNWYQVQDAFLVPPHSGIVFSGRANRDDHRYRLNIKDHHIQHRPKLSFHARPLYELPIPAIDTELTACLEIHNYTNAFVSVLCMRIVDSITTTHPALSRHEQQQHV